MPYPNQARPRLDAGRTQGAGQPAALPPIHLMAGDKMHPDLLTTTAEKCAKKIMQPGKTMLTRHQLRRFYSDVKSLEKRVRERPDGFEEFWPLVGMLKAKVAYASDPKKPKIPKVFKDFIDRCVDQIEKDRKRFLVFCKFFEAVVGYLYGEGIAEQQR